MQLVVFTSKIHKSIEHERVHFESSTEHESKLSHGCSLTKVPLRRVASALNLRYLRRMRGLQQFTTPCSKMVKGIEQIVFKNAPSRVIPHACKL